MGSWTQSVEGGGGSVEQNAFERVGLEGCFTFTSLFIGVSDFVMSRCLLNNTVTSILSSSNSAEITL